MLVMITGVLASFELKGHSIQKAYVSGEKIKGTINLSFNNEPGKNLLTSNFQGNITLIDFLNINNFSEGTHYNCSTPNCGTDYIAQNEITELNLNGKKIIGLKIFGNDITDIESASFKVSGNGGDSCIPPLIVDFLDSGDYNLVPDKYTGFDSCFSTNYGCFDRNLGNYQDVSISINPYCENMTLAAAPAFKLGAFVKNSTTGKISNLTMQLYDHDEALLGECMLPMQTEIEEELDCIVEYTAPAQKDYLVCLVGKRSNTDGANYKIRSETQSNVCGTDNFGSTYGRDYELFAKTMRFAETDFEINDSVFEAIHGDRLSNYAFDYILEKYNSVCNPSCVIPIALTGISQNLVFSDALIKYKDGNTLVSDDALYSISLEEPKITSKTLKLNLGLANFVIPESSNANRLEIFLGNERIINEPITIVRGFSFDVNPKFVAFGQAVNFIITSSVNVTSATWNFGDGDVETANGKSITHTYLDERTFTLKVDARAANGTSSKQFSISVANAQESARITLEDYNRRIDNLKGIIITYPSWMQGGINSALTIEDNEARLDELQLEYNSAQNESDYADVMNALLGLEIPVTLNASKKGIVPITIGADNINTDFIEQLSTEGNRDNDAVKEAIAGWMSENTDAEIEFETITGFYGDSSDPIITSFKVDITPASGAKDSYFIIPAGIDEVTFKSSYNEKAIGEGVYIAISTQRREIEFILSGEVGVEELGLYISPALQNLDIVADEEISEYEEPGFALGRFSTGIIALLIIAFIAYIILQEWYKRNYERSLFKSEESFYNLINFINNARDAGLTEGQIKARLKQNGWSGEQVTYASRKLDGKRTGMFEIPIFKFAEKRKVKEELEKRKQGGGATFIKEPRF